MVYHLIELVVHFGVYGEFEDGGEGFRWEELEQRDGVASDAQANLLGT